MENKKQLKVRMDFSEARRLKRLEMSKELKKFFASTGYPVNNRIVDSLSVEICDWEERLFYTNISTFLSFFTTKFPFELEGTDVEDGIQLAVKELQSFRKSYLGREALAKLSK